MGSVPNCGYHGHSAQDLGLHFGLQHNASVQMLQRENINLKSLLDKNFQFLTETETDLTFCLMCPRKVAKKHLKVHMALAHLYQKYFEEMRTFNSWTTMRASSKCPLCAYQYGIGSPPTEAVSRTRDILLVKHFASVHVSPVDIMYKYNMKGHKDVTTERHIPPKPTRHGYQGSSSSLHEDSWLRKELQLGMNLEHERRIEEKVETQEIFCKNCKKIVARKTNDVITLNTSHKKACFSLPEKLKCMVCDMNILLDVESVRRHFQLEEHVEKEKMYNLLTKVYAKARGFDITDGYHPTNYKFFILALKAYAVHNPGMTVSNCLSMLMSVLEMSVKQYNELYRHVDTLAKGPIPNYLCYCCNYAEYGTVSGLSKHVQSEEHLQSIARLQSQDILECASEYLSCSGCGALFNSDSIMNHAEHLLEPVIETSENEDSEEDAIGPTAVNAKRIIESSDDEGKDEDATNRISKKRKLETILNEHDPDLTLTADEGSAADSTGDPNFDVKDHDEVEDEEEYVIDNDDVVSSPRSLPSDDEDDDDQDQKDGSDSVAVDPNSKVNEDDCGSLVTASKMKPQNLDNNDVTYYYFCLDCEKEHAGTLAGISNFFRFNIYIFCREQRWVQ